MKISDLTDDQLQVLSAISNVTITVTNAPIILAHLQTQLLKFEIVDEIKRRKDGSPSTK